MKDRGCIIMIGSSVGERMTPGLVPYSATKGAVHRKQLNEEEFRWLRIFADYAAIALTNARGFGAD
jgi:NAD(P)-dependent dehydrogenase (short-subunit alcohol dehydrogenase family)